MQQRFPAPGISRHVRAAGQAGGRGANCCGYSTLTSVDACAAAGCGGAQVRRFVKYALGEGIEKKESNLAAEVAAATGQQ